MPGHAGRGLDARLPGGQHGMGMGQARRAAQDAQVLAHQRLQAATVERRQGGTGLVGEPAGGQVPSGEGGCVSVGCCHGCFAGLGGRVLRHVVLRDHCHGPDHRMVPAGAVRNGPCGVSAHHHAFQQRVAGQPVGAMQAGAGGFAQTEEVLHLGVPGRVADDAAAGVVLHRADRNRAARDVDAMRQTMCMNGGEVPQDEAGGPMADVQPDVGQ